MKDGIEHVVNGLPEENLGVFAASRDTQIKAEPLFPVPSFASFSSVKSHLIQIILAPYDYAATRSHQWR